MTGRRGTALLTLGRLPVVLELARSLRRLGWRTVVADPLALHLARLSNAVDRSARVAAPARDAERWLDDLARLCAEEGADVVVPVSEEVAHLARIEAREGFDVPVLCPAPDDVMALHDKWRFARWAREAGLAVPATERCDAPAAEALAASVDHVVKPRLSSSGVGVRFGRAGDPLPVRDASHLVQARLGPDALSTCTLAAGGVPLVTAAYRARLLSGSVAVRFESVAVPDEVRRTIETAARERRVDGAVSFDFLADADGRWRAIECNPRATSGLHLMGGAALDAALARCLEGLLGRDRAAGAPSVASSEAPADVAPGAALEIGPGRVRQEFWTSLTELQGRALRGRVERADWRALVATPDVTWSRADPWPWIGMTPASLPLLWRAIRRRRPITEVTVEDVGLHGAVADASGRARGGGRDGVGGSDAGGEPEARA